MAHLAGPSAARGLIGRRWQDRLAGRPQRTEPSARVRVARDELERIRELTGAITTLEQELAGPSPRSVHGRWRPGLRTPTAAKLIKRRAGETDPVRIPRQRRCDAQTLSLRRW